MTETAAPSRRGVFVTDFDGTLTHQEFYELISELIPPGTSDLWPDFQGGRITHFEFLQRKFASMRTDETRLLAVMERCELDPRAGDCIQRLEQRGWSVIVASAGCEWYVQRLLASRGICVPILSNPGVFSPSDGLSVSPHADPRYASAEYGIDKAAVVREALRSTPHVAFAGNGSSDFEAATLVDPELRFARQDLALLLRKAGLAFQPFEFWSEIAERLVQSSLQC